MKELISFTVPADRPEMPSIYTPNEEHRGEGYRLWVPREKVEYLISPAVNYLKPFIPVRSRVRPEVIPGNKNVDRLVKELTRLDARNLPRDRIFDGEPLLVTVLNYDWECRGGAGKSVALVSVEFYKGC